MTTQSIDKHYSMLRNPDVDAIRVKQYEAIMDDPEFPEEVKILMERDYASIILTKGYGDTIAKSLVISWLRLALATPAEEKEMIRMGWMHNALAPEAWQANNRKDEK